MSGGDTLPKPALRDIPVLVTGNSRQSVAWIAEHADGWLYYPQNEGKQAETIRQWRALHQGFKSGHRFLVDYLGALRDIGVNHVGFNLKYGSRPAAEVVQELGEFVVPHFPAHANFAAA